MSFLPAAHTGKAVVADPLLFLDSEGQDATQQVLRLARSLPEDLQGARLRLRVSAGLGPASPTAGVMNGVVARAA
jgi:hypothetical protein